MSELAHHGVRNSRLITAKMKLKQQVWVKMQNSTTIIHDQPKETWQVLLGPDGQRQTRMLMGERLASLATWHRSYWN